MKRTLLILTLALTLTLLFSQTQELPDLTVSGESSFKPFLYKRSLLFSPELNMGDSLPAFVPPGVPLQEKPKPIPAMQHRSYLQFEGNMDFGLNSFISYYPDSFILNALTYTLDMRSPISEMLSVHNNLFLGTELSSHFPLSFRFQNVSSQADDFDNTVLDFNFSHHRPDLTIGNVSFKDISAQLGYNYIYQKNLNKPYKCNYLNVYLASCLEEEILNWKTKFMVKSGDFGIQIAPVYNGDIMDISKPGIHLLADAYTIVPSLEFLYRYPITGWGVLSLSNVPLLEGNDYLSFLEATPWISFSDAHKLKKTPLNFNAGLEYLYPQKINFSLGRLNINNNLRYEIDSPVLVSTNNYRIPTLRYTDVFSNLTSVEAFFKMDKLNMHQGLELELAYLTESDYTRAPYRPLLNLDSRFAYGYGNWYFNLDILQHYFTKDHRGHDLPEAIILNLGAEYHKDNSAAYAQLANLFNRKEWVFSEQPGKGRNLYIGLKHRF
ncbi:MAG TPA: hypothetical protein PLW08_04615 [Candidatus Cloacimonas acidaminovorans]|nr:hypothetical protein [Candidatus Cloacimonas acidaminovorans]